MQNTPETKAWAGPCMKKYGNLFFSFSSLSPLKKNKKCGLCLDLSLVNDPVINPLYLPVLPFVHVSGGVCSIIIGVLGGTHNDKELGTMERSHTLRSDSDNLPVPDDRAPQGRTP